LAKRGRVNGPGNTLLEQQKRKAQHSFLIKEKQIWAIREKKIKAKRNTKKRLSVLKRKNGN